MRKTSKISINMLSIGVFLLVALLMAFFGVEIREVNLRVREQTQIEESQRLCQIESQAMADASDYLTSEVWHFVATQKVQHLKNYWIEVYETKRRENALARLYDQSLTQQEKTLVQNAKRESDRLIVGEAWAMRLVADSIGLALDKMPPEVAAVKYRNGEDLLSPEEKQRLASKYIFGEDYTASKDLIKGNIEAFRELLRTRKEEELNAAVIRTGNSLKAAQYFMIALMLAIILETALYYAFIIRPFHVYVQALEPMGEKFTPLEPRGAREIVAFATAFNKIYAEWNKQKERLVRERNRFHVALENTSVIVYEYDFTTDTYSAYGTLEEGQQETSLERVIPFFMEKRAAEIMGKEGMQALQCLIKEGTPVELQVKPYVHDTKRIWILITGKPVLGPDGNPVKFIGKISNIESEKQKEFALEDAQSRDGLTGLYKRKAGIRKVREFMENKSPDMICGIMLLDMDDFKRINETEGQTFADAVLQSVADILRAKTGPDDIQVRLGGDEFMLFIKNCPKSRATVLGPQIARQIQELSIQDKPDFRISASIGMCVTEVVDEYSGLYRCAESTLKYVKEHGKGQAACYLDTSNELGMMLTQMYPDSHFINDIERSEGSREDLISFALDLLGKSKNLDDAIFLLLARVGKIYRFDRVTILEVDMEYLSCRYVYQWAKNPADRQTAETHFVSREILYDLTASYDEDGLSDRYILPSGGNLDSILHAAIWNYGSYVGSICFEMRGPHVWTADERRLLCELTKIISSFTLKARADAVSQAKTDFLSRMSHEIRTPMNAITGMTAIAKTVLDDPGRTMDCLNKIESANAYLLSLINDVLDMSRIESGKVELHKASVDLASLTDELAYLLRPQAAAKGLCFTVENRFAGGRVVADELRLNQVLVNLLSNAVKFTGKGGSVTLRVSAEADGQVRFAVSDTGIGIGREAQGRIFNAFEQAGSDTAANYGGTGLGLAISSRLVQLMGGTLEVDSELGKGSTFYFTLPLPDAPDAPVQSTATERPVFNPRGSRLLLAEDNALNQEIAQELLTMHGFEVETVNDGAEAVKQFQEREPGYYAAILMDIRMPVMDGMEATRRIRTLGRPDSRTVPILAMTANAFDEDMKKSLENGMDGHLTKPIDVEKLLKTLEKLIFRGAE